MGTRFKTGGRFFEATYISQVDFIQQNFKISSNGTFRIVNASLEQAVACLQQAGACSNRWMPQTPALKERATAFVFENSKETILS